MVAEVPVGPTDNRKMKIYPAVKEVKKFSENEDWVLPGFMMESYQVRFAIPTDDKKHFVTILCLINIHMTKQKALLMYYRGVLQGII